MTSETGIIFKAIIPEPLEYIELFGKRVNKKTGKAKHRRYYLTANLFYAGINPFVRIQIIEKAKFFLFPHLKSCPQLTDPPYSLVFQYCRKKHIDLDDKLFFWNKIIQDILAPPAMKRKTKYKEEKQKIIEHLKASGRIENDNSDFIDCVGYEYYKTKDHCLVFTIIKN